MLAGDAAGAARALLGALLVSRIEGVTTAGRVVEVEAYIGPDDPASHAAQRTGRTRRNAPMFGDPGTAYVYRIYGVHRCFNVVTGPVGFPAAVLVRALEPLYGLDAMARRRGRGTDLCSGPGRLASALAIDETLNSWPLTEEPLRIVPDVSVTDGDIGVSGRIGVSRAANWPLRYYVRGNPHVSRKHAPSATSSAAFRAALSTARSRATLEHT